MLKHSGFRSSLLTFISILFVIEGSFINQILGITTVGMSAERSSLRVAIHVSTLGKICFVSL